MREKLLELLKSEGLKPSQLAEILEINPAGISHILAGRNKPSFELLQKILRRFPRINPDWLLLDSDQIYRSETSSPTSASDGSSSASASANHSMPKNGMENSLFGNLTNPAQEAGPRRSNPGSVTGVQSEIHPDSQIVAARNPSQAGVKRIVIFYEDQTFEVYTPATR